MERKTYCDYLRIIAIFAVVVIHVSVLNWHDTDVNGVEWQTFNFYDSIARWGVPIFLMISGSLFLNRDIPIKRIYSKYVLRLAIAFVVWNIFYASMHAETFQYGLIYGLKSHLGEIAMGPYHMWFILMIIGIYICIPFYKKIVEDRSIMKYFLILSFIFAFFIPWTIQLLNDYAAVNSEFVAKLIILVDSNISSMSMHTVLGYSFYFILGYYLDSIELDKKQRILIYILGLAGFAFTVLVDLNLALATQQPCNNYYESFNVNVVCEAVCIHTLFKYRRFENAKLNLFVRKMAGYIFGVYLVHLFFVQKFSTVLNFDSLSFNPIVSVPVVSIVVFICSLLISVIINHIPVLNKYIV